MDILGWRGRIFWVLLVGVEVFRVGCVDWWEIISRCGALGDPDPVCQCWLSVMELERGSMKNSGVVCLTYKQTPGTVYEYGLWDFIF